MLSGSALSTERFLDELFGEYAGIVYAPVLRAGFMNQYFFEWPLERDKLLKHIAIQSKTAESYLAPSLYREKKVTRDSWLGTHWVWTEFDGNAPTTNDLVPPPSIRVQSSLAGYEHWYWKLSDFNTDIGEVTKITKKLAYNLGADLSAWSYSKILRPPGTRNHKRSMTVKVLDVHRQAYSTDEFSSLELPQSNIDVTISDKLPELKVLVAKYKWPDDAIDLLYKSLDDVGNVTGHRDRSAALTRLALHCVEMGMSNDEIFVVIDDADKRWRKFTGRTDRKERLNGLISYARSKKAVDLQTKDEFLVYRFEDFMNTELTMKWVIPGLLPVACKGVIFGTPGVGKSTWAIRMGIAIATGQDDFLGWPIERSQRVMFMSLEMGHEELKFFMQQMSLGEGTSKALQNNFFVWPVGHSYPFNIRDQQIEILKYIDEHQIELLIVDSLGLSLYGSISDDEEVKKIQDFLNEELVTKRKCGYFFVHHPRKPGSAEVKRPKDMSDVFGSSYIVNNAQTLILLASDHPTVVNVEIFKSRLDKGQQSFRIRRTANRDFVRVSATPSKREEEGMSMVRSGFGRQVSL